jgi:hypothetical protein
LILVLGVLGCDGAKPAGGKAPAPPEQAGRKPGPPEPRKPRETDRTAHAPIPKGKWDLSYAEKTWGIRLKDFKYVEDDRPTKDGSGMGATTSFWSSRKT